MNHASCLEREYSTKGALGSGVEGTGFTRETFIGILVVKSSLGRGGLNRFKEEVVGRSTAGELLGTEVVITALGIIFLYLGGSFLSVMVDDTNNLLSVVDRGLSSIPCLVVSHGRHILAVTLGSSLTPSSELLDGWSSTAACKEL